MCRRDATGRDSTYFDGGDFTPYCIESLLELLRAETRAPHESLGLTLELRGDCNPATIRELARRFASIDAPNFQVRICAAGHPPAIVGNAAPGSLSFEDGNQPSAGKRS
jgi:hypothetical protein